jgi:transcriptional regulatory protein LevR
MSVSFGDEGMLFQERFDLLVASGQANPQSVAATQMALDMVERHYGIRLTEELGTSLVNHLAVTLKRLMEGETLIKMPDVVWQELRDYPEECALAESIVTELEKTLKISLARDELGFISVHLCKIRTESGLNTCT